MTTQSNTTRFRHIDDTTDTIYVGEVEITEERGDFGETITDATILSCWAYGMTVEEVQPYAKGFPADLRRAIIQTAFEQRQTPPATPVELPSDWEEFEVLDMVTRYTISANMALPTVRTRNDALTHGLVAVRRIEAVGNKYSIDATGSIEDVRRELRRVKYF